MSVTSLTYNASPATVANLLSAAPSLAQITSPTESVWVYLKNFADAFVTNVIGPPVDSPVGITTFQVVTSSSSGASTTVTVASTAKLAVGMLVLGSGVPPFTFITSISSSTVFVVSNAITTYAYSAGPPIVGATQLLFGSLPYYDGSTYRDNMSAAFTGTPEKAYGIASSSGILSVAAASALMPTSDVATFTPPKPWPKTRNRIIYQRMDANGNALACRSFWADQWVGDGDAPRQTVM